VELCSSSLSVEGIVTRNYVRYALFLIFCSAPVLARNDLAPPTQVTAVVLPDGRYSKVAIREMGREAAHILKRSSVSLRWHIGAPSQSVNGLLVVVKLVGHCDMDGSPAYLVPGPLGWSHEVNGKIIPFSDLACDNLRGAVESAVAEGNRVRANVLLGRAMGRVLAHELYHVVADTSVHGHQGVAQAALSPRQLTSGELELGPSEVEALESGLTRAR
jgi:hypothetical protein